tara:strand:- start:904 stop:1065 length:162 start_codon:yes stop_codon:yes gene_type:complete
MDKAARFLSLKYTAKYTAILQGDLSLNVSLDGIVGSKLSAVRPVFTAFLDYYF